MLYIHIPFCKRRCIYCDFYSTTDLDRTDRYVEALLREYEERKQAYPSAPKSIYFGGGTPSQLSSEQIRRIFSAIDYSQAQEITLEANPDDLTDLYIRGLVDTPINRISMGIQSFDDACLRFLNRRHSAAQAIEAVGLCQKYGFSNISIDLMFGLPGQSIECWEQNIDRAIELGVQHISAYGLMYEEGTQLYRKLEIGEVKEVDDELYTRYQSTLEDRLLRAGYHRYEVSNYARHGFESKHNSGYWKHIPYLGIGAAAHSFDGKRRIANPADLHQYLQNDFLREEEELTDRDLFNEIIMLSLRTTSGLDLSLLGALQAKEVVRSADLYLKSGQAQIVDNRLSLTSSGFLIANRIMVDLIQ